MTEQEHVPKPQLHKMFTKPLQQFDLIRKKPLIIKPIITILILVIFGSLLAGIAAGDFNILDPTLLLTVMFTALLVFPVALLIGSLIQLGLSTFAKDSTVTLQQLYSMNTHLAIIAVLGMFLNGIIALLFNIHLDEQLTSLAFYVHKGNVADFFLSNIEVFSIWNLILVIFGLQRIADFPKILAWITVIILFFV